MNVKKYGFIFICFYIFVNAFLFADDGFGYIDASLGGFQIKNSDYIEMSDETVEIWNDHVKVTFHFKNLTDMEQNVTIGFPVMDFRYNEYKSPKMRNREFPPLGDDEDTRKKIDDYYQFKSFCDGEVLPRKLTASVHKKESKYDDNKYDFWYTTELHFKPYETLEITDEYNSGHAYSEDSRMCTYVTWSYVLTTGSTWANVIKKADIIFHTSNNVKWENFQYLFEDRYQMKYRKKSKYTVNDFIHWYNKFIDLNGYYYYGYTCTYKPSFIYKDQKNDETVIIWNLKNIKPKNDWIFKSYYSSWGYDGDVEDLDCLDFIPELIKNDLIKTFDEKNACTKWDYWFEENSENISYRNKKINEISANEYKGCIKEFFRIGFSCLPKKTVHTEVYARFLINSIYALHGYEFNKAELRKLFEQFSWYSPVKEKNIENEFSEDEKEMIELLKTYIK